MLLYIIDQILIEILLLYLGGIFFLVHHPVQVQDQIVDQQRYPRLPPETLHLHLLNQLKDLKLRGVKCNHITVKHIFPGHFRALHQVAVCRRKFHQPAGIFPADPEHEPAVCLRMVVHNGPVPAVRRNYHHIPIAERVSLPLNLNRDVPLHKKIELIIVVCVRIHF